MSYLPNSDPSSSCHRNDLSQNIQWTFPFIPAQNPPIASHCSWNKKKKNHILTLQGSHVLTPACLTSSFLALLPLILSLCFFLVLKHVYLSLPWDFAVKGPCAPEMDFPENPSLLLPEAGQLPFLVLFLQSALFCNTPLQLYEIITCLLSAFLTSI